MARLFSLVFLGDFTSVYLSLLYNIDPTPIKAIDHLKKELAK
ncbi:MAG: SIS domain-containing protein [Candidatus Firestonebacteria bacterium]